MKRLLVVYDKNIKDKGRDSYLKAIKREIPRAEIFDVRDPIVPRWGDKVLILRPMNNLYRTSEVWFSNSDRDIEGIYTGKLTITAEAILRVIGEVENKTILIINQSDVLGKPLAKELIELGANVFSINSSFSDYKIIKNLNPDILISASGDDDFKLKGSYLKDIKTIIDLSDDIDYENKITSIPTIEVLKDRLRL